MLLWRLCDIPAMRTFINNVVIPLLTLALLVLGFLYLANARDEPLSDASRALLVYEPPTDAVLQNNGYLIIGGLDAPSDDANAVASATRLGIQRVMREIERKQWVVNGDWHKENQPPAITPEHAQKYQDLLPDALRCIPETTPSCHEWYIQNQTRLRALIADRQAVLRRVEAAAYAPQFSNPEPPYALSLLPPYQNLIRAQELQLARASLLLKSGQTGSVIAIIEQGDTLARQLAEGSGTLIGNLIGLAIQYRTLRWLVDVSHTTSPSPELRAHILAVLQRPVVPIQKGLEGEMRNLVSLYQHLGKDHRDWADLSTVPGEKSFLPARLTAEFNRITFLPQQTTNLQQEMWQPCISLATAPADKIDTVIGDLEVHMNKIRNTRNRWFGVRNFSGNVVLDMSTPNCKPYVERRIDVDAYRRMAILLWQAQTQKIPRAQMTAWLAHAPENLRDPYTLQPMQWDAATNSLEFEGRQPQSQNPERSKTYRVKF